ncbi:hypothetical protein RND71_014995 [Anisodus tanguticus]|uniref:Pyruvate kinase n=1 Tax=Anisodus tanguticus TaxID=243964 RepID=A0AAE1SCA7_9SOLA|nr:hypothetical protein RND71_014995 [Anisodus tanguticus]
MSVARFDFSWGDAEYHQETLENLKAAIKNSEKLYAVMLDTGGPELQVATLVVLTPDQDKEAVSNLLPINFCGLSESVKNGDTIFIGQYLFTGRETTSVWLEVTEVKGEDVVCLIKNSATLDGPLYTLHVSKIRIDLPTLTDKDKKVISSWAFRNKIDILSLSYTRDAEDVRRAREFLSKLGNLNQTHIYAKIENVEVFLFQKTAVHKCNMAGKPSVVTRAVDSMTDNLRPTRAEATDVANTAEKVYNQDVYFKRTVKHVGEPMSHLESIASSAVRAGIKVKASVIICFTSSGRAARWVGLSLSHTHSLSPIIIFAML